MEECLALEKPLGKLEEGRVPWSSQSPAFTFLGEKRGDMSGLLYPLPVFRSCHVPSQWYIPAEAPVSELSVPSRALSRSEL